MSGEVASFLAMQDVLNEVADDADSLSADEAIAALEALGELASVVKRTASAVDTALRQHLEGGARQLGNRMYGLGKKGEWRFNHTKFLRAVVDHILTPDEDSGEIPSARDAAITAARTVFDAYASKSTKIKEGAITALGLNRAELTTWEHTGSEIKAVDLDAPKGAT